MLANNEWSPTVVDDPDDYTQLKGLEEAHDTRKACRLVRQKVTEYELFGELDTRKANKLYRTAVESYIMEFIPLLQQPDLTDENYWEEIDLGVIPHPKYGTERGKRVVGLERIIRLPSPLVWEYTTTTEHPVRGRSQEVERVETEIPRGILDNAVIAVDQFRQDVDLGKSLGEVPYRSTEPLTIPE